MNATYRLVVQSGADAGKFFPIEIDQINIGRERNNQVVINDVEVSRVHAILKFDGTRYTLEDHGSTNGTYVNGMRLTTPITLRGGEIISLGENSTLLFERIVPEQQTAAAAGAVSLEPQLDGQPIEVLPEPLQPVQAAAVSTFEPEAGAGEFSGQIPAQPLPKKRKKISIWVILAILGVVIVCCGITLVIIDQTRSWCYLFGWFFNTIDPGACP